MTQQLHSWAFIQRTYIHTKKLYTNVYSSFIYNSQELGENSEVLQWASHETKLRHIQTWEYYPANKKKETIDTCNLDDTPRNYIALTKKNNPKGYILGIPWRSNG